jgi:hypothetical protein
MPLPEHLAELERRVRERFDAAVDDLRRQYETRLRQTHEETLAGLSTLRPTASDPFEGLDTAALALQPRGTERSETLSALIAGARAIDHSTTQAQTLEALLAAARRFVARAGLLLVRVDSLVGWGSAGFDGDPFSGRELDWDDAGLAGLASGRGAILLDGDEARRMAESLGIAAIPGRVALVPLVLRDRVAAALYADAEPGAPPIPLGALQLLVHLAAAHLELSALGERTFTPTFYELADAPAVGLALWSPSATAEAPPAAVEPVAAPVPPPVAAAPVPIPVAVEAPEPEVEAEVEAEPAAAAAEEAPAVEERAEVEGLFVAEEEAAAAEPVEEAETPVAEAPAAGLEDSFWGTSEAVVDADRAGFAVEAEPEPEPVPEPAPEPEPPAAPAAVSEATVRIPAFRPAPPAEAAPAAEVAPAPAEETTGALGFTGTGTQEVPRVEAPPPAPQRDTSEDATVLMTRAEPAAPAPEPPPAPPVAPPRTESEDDTVERTGTRGGARTTEVAPPPDVSGPGLAFAAGRAARSSSDNALHDEARRLARLLVSEIKLYNEEQVLEGRRNRDLYVRLREDIDRSRQIYEERVHESVRSSTDYFHQELVRSLAGGDARALGM